MNRRITQKIECLGHCIQEWFTHQQLAFEAVDDFPIKVHNSVTVGDKVLRVTPRREWMKKTKELQGIAKSQRCHLLFQLKMEGQWNPFMLVDVFPCHREDPCHPHLGVPWLRETRETSTCVIVPLNESTIVKQVLLIKDHIESNSEATIWFVDTPIPKRDVEFYKIHISSSTLVAAISVGFVFEPLHKVIFSGRFLQVTPDEAKTIHDVFKTKKQEGNFSENLGKSQNGRPKDKNQRRD
eukprot:CAMPEP_0168555362 /NCGR_PEP_ID=MMETSP0413-20121227/8291_1 /TAXON_ID=136452 /ORGANISM="Filamoeba nolandi, Strain NC-AS-23-1" /LENGTH=238 /DNA_ID=CAMNT_0008586201 /DNA_START=60 /DNA_END=777 /DNA_ORIENTATION=+